MCADDRNTFNLGLSLVPLTFARTRTCRRWRGVSALRNLRRIRFAPRQHVAALPPVLLLGLTGLTRLAAHLLTRVADAFAFVRFGRANTPYACRLLTNQLLIDTDNGEARISVESIRDALRWAHPHRVREADRQDELATLERRPVADALDLQIALVSIGDTNDHVIQQSSCQSMKRAVLSLVVRSLDYDRAIIFL